MVSGDKRLGSRLPGNSTRTRHSSTLFDAALKDPTSRVADQKRDCRFPHEETRGRTQGRESNCLCLRTIHAYWIKKEDAVCLFPGQRHYDLRKSVSLIALYLSFSYINARFRQEASSAALRGLADGSFRKVEVTPRVKDAFERATESALQVIDISDTESL
jgi:hypothetical protein